MFKPSTTVNVEYGLSLISCSRHVGKYKKKPFTTKHIQAHTNNWLTLFHNFVLILNIQQSLVGNAPTIMILCSSNAAVS